MKTTIATTQLKTVYQAMRPSFLVLSPVCVFLGLSTSLTSHSPINLFLFILILVAALLAHISVNTLNEYYDFKSGLDLITNKTPFSGGSGALPDNPEMAKTVQMTGLLSLSLTTIIGLYLVTQCGIQILPIGIVGLILVISYTPWLNRFPLLCLIAPGLGFGFLMVTGTHVLLSNEHSLLAWLVALVPFFLINNLLLLNQYPDIRADSTIGRNTFPIAFGLKRSNQIYALFMISAYGLIVFLLLNGLIPRLGIIALIPMLFSLYALLGAIKYASKIADAPSHLAANVAAAISTPLLLAIAIIYGQ